MPVSVTMPRLGESVTEGTVTRWLKQEGDTVEVDEPLLEVSTDKVDTEIPSPAAGVLSRIVVGEDETAEVGSELAVIAGEGESAAGGGEATPQEQAPAEAVEPAAEPTAAAEGTADQVAQDEAPAEAPAPAAASSGEGTAVKMPALGESVTEGTVTRWLKQVGETIEVDEPLLEVSTDKVDTEIPSPVAGTVLEIKVAEDETAAVGADLAIIGVAGGTPAQAKPEPKPEPQAEAKPEPKAEPKPEPKVQEPTPGMSYNEPAAETESSAQPAKTEQAAQPAAAASTPPRPSAPAQGGGEEAAGYVTPLVRKLAAEHGVDLSSLNGTGVGGRIRKQDVLEAAEKAKAAPAPAAAPAAAPSAAAAKPAAKPQPSGKRGTVEKLPRIRKAIATRLHESLHEMAQLTTVVEVDVTRIAKLRAQAKDSFVQRHGVKLSFLPFFALAAIEALQTYPIVNARMDLEGGTITYPEAEHLGIAVDTERGLLTPVIHNAGDLNLGGIAKRVADLAERTRTNKISPDEIAGATFTLTNTGSRGALFDTPIVPSPQSAMLGTGAVVKRPVVVNDPELGEVVAVRSMVYLALSYDHRLIDGADAARFLTAVKERLEAGNFESELGLA
ncbi:2-oxoglutarate dehydrogenase, E2 component, dihydrolipoamide succinyltransferase [Micromonospora sp. WMMD1155]|uniref:2-oxoglutarate dehydrogenase, E2 component, dihydrolipoamide succinyltransferase n=1 Tax=Micromonospora sp. WMMD1155 TaxID=3016094 RepID=UPI00249B3A55|nr:2-oxoglutarate dehydrogenase, E2 component, dihydrolipoamide succinyltransferase [Micromonospora sp. WMMD1155]WFE52557.1 2-oxoglutarate dehydrogenase, E2 component, dihydrolipoamide succinyltransferase [Micromonospora sp. WMMD1155]